MLSSLTQSTLFSSKSFQSCRKACPWERPIPEWKMQEAGIVEREGKTEASQYPEGAKHVYHSRESFPV